jgi:hypothetical protein
MLELSAQTSHLKRAVWVGVRTLRQRPRVVGYTGAGECVFAVRSVRLVLRRDADHFNRLLACSECGGELLGEPVFTAAELARRSRPVVCTVCQSGPVPAAESAVDWPRPPEATFAPVAPSPPAPVLGVSVLEARIDDMRAQLRALAGAQYAEAVDRRRAEDVTRAGLQRAVLQRVVDLRAEMAESARAAAARMQAIEDELSLRDVEPPRGVADPTLLATLVGTLTETRSELGRVAASHRDVDEAHAEELAALTATLAKVRGEVERVSRSNRDLVRGQRALERQVAELSAGADGRPHPAPRAVPPLPGAEPDSLLDFVDRKLREVDQRLARRAGRNREAV